MNNLLSNPDHGWPMVLLLTVSLAMPVVSRAAESEPSNARKPEGAAELRYWLENMVRHHRFTPAEASKATGLSIEQVQAELKRLNIGPGRPPVEATGNLLVLPYPGGRHPRIGFLEGAIRPQRETKVSVFTPWDPKSYVVVDVPEAIWSNLGLTYLAHTHVPTVWSKQGIELEKLEWNRRDHGVFELQRRLPNGIAFTSKVVPKKDSVRMELRLTNGTKSVLTDLRVQNCVMLKSAAGFADQSNDNKTLSKPYAACRSTDGKRWVITAWEPCHRPWANQQCPCLHSDPKFPDCKPGETKVVRGWLSFYEGTDIEGEFRRIDKIGWRTSLE